LSSLFAYSPRWKLIEAYFCYLIICSGCKCHFINLIFKGAVEDSYAAPCFEKLSFVINWFNLRKCLFLPMLRSHMQRLFGCIFALLTYVSTRFSSGALCP
jgi:hypothetical protein